MKKLLALLLVCMMLAGCSPAPLFEAEHVSDKDKPIPTILPHSTEATERAKPADEQITSLAPINYEWYLACPTFTREDGKHTFQMGWIDDEYLEFIIDDMEVIGGTLDVDDSTIPNGLLYESIENNTTVEVVYYYVENYIEITDNRNASEDYSGVYLLEPSAILENENKPQVPDWYSRRIFLNPDLPAFIYAVKTEDGHLLFRIYYGDKLVGSSLVDAFGIPLKNVEIIENKEDGGYEYIYKFFSDNPRLTSSNNTVVLTYSSVNDSLIVYSTIPYPVEVSGVYGYWQDFPN